MLDQVLSTARDIIPLKVGKDRATFAFPFEGDVAKYYFDKTSEDNSERDIEGFNRYWQYNPEAGLIEGSSTLLALRLDTKTRPDSIWLPTVQEAIILDEKGKFTNNSYRDFGLAVYSDGDPNQKIASEIKEEFDGNLPILISFRNLDYRLDSNFPNGIAITLSKDREGILNGEEATEYLTNNNFYTEDKGACGVNRDWSGSRDACWRLFDYSNDAGRVDWMVAEGSRADIEAAYTGKNGIIEREYNAKITKLESERDQRKQSFLDSLS